MTSESTRSHPCSKEVMEMKGVKGDRTILNWRRMMVIIAISFGVGMLTASHRAILAQLGQINTRLLSATSSRNGTASRPQENSPLSNSETLASTPSLESDRPAPAGMEAPNVAMGGGDVRLVVMSDINGRYGDTTYGQAVLTAVQLIPAWQPDLVLCVGGMVGGQLLSLTATELEAMWAGFDRQIFQPIRQAGLPMAIAIGKPDGSNLILAEDAETIPNGVVPGSYVFAQERNAAKTYWTNPERDLGVELVDTRQFPFQYSFVHNDIFYLVWDASSSDLSDEALAWAEQTLASAAAQQAKVRISLSHYPLYAVAQGRDRPSEYLSRGEEVQALLERYDVHTHISGHHQAYFPGKVGELELLHSGSLGIGPRSWLGTDAPPQRTLTVMDIFFDGLPEPDPADGEGDTDDQARSPNTAEDSAETRGAIATLYTTYDMATGAVIDQAELPRVIASPTGLVLRQDVDLEDLTYEDNQRYIRSW
ncbi:MAG: metallophosphoesterase [Leptolyngbyaceae bacterium]|nr:metallophosphoesterase [Leptolyngbyaceae bacterium]